MNIVLRSINKLHSLSKDFFYKTRHSLQNNHLVT